MAHGGYARRQVEERRPVGRRSKGLRVDKKTKKKQRTVSLKNQIRSIERLLRKNLPAEMREAQERKLEDFKRQQEIQTRLTIEPKIHLRDRKIKFFERRKIERTIRRLEKQHRSLSDHASEESISKQLSQLREDLEYVRFFPKNEKYVSLFVGREKPEIVDKRNTLRKQIKDNLIAAAANGKDLEETASDDDALDMSEDDFFVNGSSSDEAEADDELTDKSTSVFGHSKSRNYAAGSSSSRGPHLDAYVQQLKEAYEGEKAKVDMCINVQRAMGDFMKSLCEGLGREMPAEYVNLLASLPAAGGGPISPTNINSSVSSHNLQTDHEEEHNDHNGDEPGEE